MIQCKVDYLSIFGRDEHAIALFFWDDKEKNKEESAVHIAIDANLFKEGTFHQIANTIESAITKCLEKISKKEKDDGRQEVYSKSDQEAGSLA